MSASLLKGHFLHSRLFPPNLCDQHGERFHQDITVMEADIREILILSMMGNCCSFLQSEIDVQYKQKSKCLKHVLAL